MDLSALSKPSLTLRIGIGKAIGFFIGLAGFVLLPLFAPEADWMLRLGLLFWYTTLGAIIGLFGVYSRHPVLELPLPWWIRAPFVGAWMNFIVTFFAYDSFKAILASMFGATGGAFASPFLFVVEGAIVGLVIGWFATWLGGEGPETVRSQPAA